MKEKIIGFFTDVVKEMNKVTWPKRDDLRDSTVIVLVVCLIIAGFVYVVDTAVSTGLRFVLEFFKG
jgi:preprotein translocase subunit SecE